MRRRLVEVDGRVRIALREERVRAHRRQPAHEARVHVRVGRPRAMEVEEPVVEETAEGCTHCMCTCRFFLYCFTYFLLFLNIHITLYLRIYLSFHDAKKKS